MTISKILAKAADLLKKYGWQQDYVGGSSTGPMCVLGALGAAKHGDPSYNNTIMPSIRRLAKELKIDSTYKAVADWNNGKDATKRKVIGALRRASKAR